MDPSGKVIIVTGSGGGCGRAAFFRTDVSQKRDIEALIEFAEQTYGGVDVVVSNAGAPGYDVANPKVPPPLTATFARRGIPRV
jgi:NAD(P)-dependent dehydrogenase (short-subunit alcohol dehydrogenase family)